MSLLRCRELTVAFGGLRALDGLSLEIEARSVTALIGPNGSGKTTLFNALSGFVRPERGTVALNSTDLLGLAPHEVAGCGVARSFQDLRLVRRATVLENVMLAMPRQAGEAVWPALWGLAWRRAEAENRAGAMRWLEHVGLADRARDLAGVLSYGQQKLLCLAVCLHSGAQLLLLDEPVAGVNPALAEQLMSHIADLPKLERSVLFIEHNLQAVQGTAERVVVLAGGRELAAGSWAEVSASPAVQEAYLR